MFFLSFASGVDEINFATFTLLIHRDPFLYKGVEENHVRLKMNQSEEKLKTVLAEKMNISERNTNEVLLEIFRRR